MFSADDRYADGLVSGWLAVVITHNVQFDACWVGCDGSEFGQQSWAAGVSAGGAQWATQAEIVRVSSAVNISSEAVLRYRFIATFIIPIYYAFNATQ